MGHNEIETKQRIYESIRSGLSGRIAKLTNFTDRSFNYVWTQAFAQEIRELQEVTLVSELAGFIDYTGGPITQDQLDELEPDGTISAERVNELMDDQYLDEYVKIVGITRNQGSVASGTVTFSTQSSETIIPAGTRVTTAPQADGSTIDFLTTEQSESPTGQTSVSGVQIESTGVGSDFNVPAGTITRISNPPVGVTGVNNPESTIGGEDEESNESLRERAKSTVGGASEGGTTEGIKTYIRNNVDAIQQGDVIIDEFVNEQPPFVDVIVDGGLDNEVRDAIEFSRPTGVRHDLVRPQVIQLGVNLDLLGTDIDTTAVEETMEEFLLELGIGEEFYQDQFIREIMVSDSDIINIDFLDTTIERVTNETFEYDTSINAAIADDGGTTTNETVNANNTDENDVTLLPESPAVGDAYYFGEWTPFSELDILISRAGEGTWDIVWEYYDGTDWVTLPNISDGTNDFKNTNLNTVSWDVPTDWTSTDFAGEKGLYFVRARLDSFTSLTTQPLGEQIFITGAGYRLDYTFEDTNGSITVEDKGGITYSQGADFELYDRSNDGWEETFIWIGGGTPNESQEFFIDYDVTVDGETDPNNSYRGNLVRDEGFRFNLGQEDVLTYNNTDQEYNLTRIPFEDSVSLVDESGITYTEDLDWQLQPTQGYSTEDTFTYDATTVSYNLSDELEVDFIAVHDADNNIYIRDSDYIITDSDSDGFGDTIAWGQDIDGAIADDGGVTTDETVEANNDTPDDMTLLSSSPAVGDAYYFGQSSIFGGFTLNISTAGAGSWDIVWEYYDGTNWVSLSDVIDGTSDFQNSGENLVEWTIPIDWDTTTVAGISGLYWVRGRVDTFSNINTQPLGQEVAIGRTPDDGVEFTASYDAYPSGIRWDTNNNTPPQDDDFTVTYDQVYYETEYEIVETPKGEITDASGDLYNEDTEYILVDESRDGEVDGVYWLQNPSTLGDGEEFFVSYITEGDIFFGDREKADPGTLSVETETL